MATCLAVLAVRDAATPVLVTALVFVEGCSAALRFPFLQSLLPAMVPPDELLGAVALGTAQYNVGRVLGPALATVVIAFGSFEAAFALNALSFLVAVAAVAAVRLPRPLERDSAGVPARIVAGARAARAEPGCRAALGLVAVLALLVAPFIALVAGRAGALVGGGEWAVARATGLLTTAQGLGAVAGALLVPTLAQRFGRRQVLLVWLVCTPVLVTVYAWAPTLWAAAAAMTLLGGSYIGALAGLQAVIQLRAPGRLPGPGGVAVPRQPRHPLPAGRPLAGRGGRRPRPAVGHHDGRRRPARGDGRAGPAPPRGPPGARPGAGRAPAGHRRARSRGSLSPDPASGLMVPASPVSSRKAAQR